MKHQFPQSARDALSRQMAADEHPSADLLNGFLERALGADENARVTAHLASCAECRDVVFLATAANQDEQRAGAAQKYVAFSPRSRWASWKWLAPTLAALAVIAGVIVYRVTTVKPPAPTLAMSQAPAQPEALSATASEEKPIPATPPKLSASRKPSSPEQADRRDMSAKKDLALQRQMASSMDEKQPAAATPLAPLMSPQSKALPASAARAASATTSLGGPSAAPLAQSFPTQNQAQANIAAPPNGVPSESSDAAEVAVTAPGASTLGAMGGKPAGIRGGNSIAYAKRATIPAPHWRISNDGHLERSTSASEWTRVLTEQPVAFRAVASIGSEVWAGGSDGALFHSSDAGEHWTQVALAADSQSEHGAVQSIRFDTSAQGRVTTDAGATWSTVDGGKTWTRQ